MKKILALMVAFMVTANVFAGAYKLSTTIADDTSYKIQFGYGLYYTNKYDFRYANGNNTFNLNLVLPVHEKLVLGLVTDFSNKLESFDSTTNSSTATEVDANHWSALNNYGRLIIGLPIIEDKFYLGIYVGGGTENMQYKKTNLKDDYNPEYILGNGYVDAAIGVQMKSELFEEKLSYLNIVVGGKGQFAGHGLGYESTSLGTNFITVADASTAYYSGEGAQYQYVGWKLNGYFEWELPISTLAGWTNDISSEWYSYFHWSVGGTTYTQADEFGTAKFATNLSKINGSFGWENIFYFHPDSSTYFGVYLYPNMSLAKTSYTLTNDTQSTDKIANSYNMTFGMIGEKSFELGAAMGIIPYIGIEQYFELALTQNILSNGTTHVSNYSFQSGAFSSDSIVYVGLQFGNWATEMIWNPTATLGLSTSEAAEIASASNIFNLTNWKFSISCTFPPPTAE